MAGISPKLPLSLDEKDGAYLLNKTIKETTLQNLKMVVLTSPGERVMDPNFGVGIRNFLFENQSESTYGAIKARITQQVGKYMPHVRIDEVEFGFPSDSFTTTSNLLIVKIHYAILGTDDVDILAISVPETI